MKNQASIQLLKVGTPINPNADTGHIMLCADADGNLRIFGENGVELPIGSAVDESRLVPTGGQGGNLLEYQEGADRGNNVNTKLLLQPATSDGQIVDQAAGNAAPVSITNSGNVVIEDNALVFTGTNSLLIPANALGMTLGGNNEFTIDIEFQLDSVKSDYATLYGSDGGSSSSRGALYFTSSGAATFTDSLGPNTTGWTLGTKHRITIERWNDNGTWKTSVYRNGSFLASSTAGMNILSNYAFPIGSNNESTNRNFIGKIWAFRISNQAEHRGVSFTPRELPFLPPAGQPVWAEGIDRSRLLPDNPVNGDISCYNATATTGGGNDANTKALLHFDAEVKDEAAGNAAPLALSSLNATIDTTVSKFGSGSLKLTSGHVFVPTPDLTAVNCVISCWVYLDSLPSSYSPLFCQDDDTAGSWNLAVDNSGIYMFCRGGTTKAKQPLQAKTWYWAAIVKSGKELRFYLNGAYIYSLTDSILRFTSLIIGIGEQINEDGRKLTGNVDEFRIQFLTADELSAWTGLTIPVPVEAYSVVQTVGEWGKFNKAELVQSVNGVTPDESGNVTIDVADESRLLPDSGPDDSWMHHSESMDLVTPTDMTSMQSADWILTAENVQNNFSCKPWGLFDSFANSGYLFSTTTGPSNCTWTRRDGTPTLIDRLELYAGSASQRNRDSYEFYGSHNGSDWILLGSWENTNWSADSVGYDNGDYYVLTLEVNNDIKYLHYKFVSPSTSLNGLKGYGVTTKNEWKKFPVATDSAAGLMSAADKAKLDGISTSEAWYTVADAAAITLDRANGELQKVTLTQNCVLTAPVLDAGHSTLLLQVTSSSAVTVTVGETNIVTDHTGTFQVGWYWDGEATRRYPAVEIS